MARLQQIEMFSMTRPAGQMTHLSWFELSCKAHKGPLLRPVGGLVLWRTILKKGSKVLKSHRYFRRFVMHHLSEYENSVGMILWKADEVLFSFNAHLCRDHFTIHHFFSQSFFFLQVYLAVFSSCLSNNIKVFWGLTNLGDIPFIYLFIYFFALLPHLTVWLLNLLTFLGLFGTCHPQMNRPMKYMGHLSSIVG